MSRASKFISLAAIAFAVMSCGGPEQAADVAKVDGVIEGAPASEVVIGKLDVNQLVILDTLTTDQDGKFQYELEVKKGNPEFVYVYYEGAKVLLKPLKDFTKSPQTINTSKPKQVNSSGATMKNSAGSKQISQYLQSLKVKISSLCLTQRATKHSSG